ncbi:MAG: antitoxin Xre/MbcA/ParS toxin-binding domain-containing protein [Desulfovibrio sp.]
MPVYPKLKQSVSSPSGKPLARFRVKRDVPPGAFELCEEKRSCASVTYTSIRTRSTTCGVCSQKNQPKKNEHSAIYTESIEDISLIADIIKRATEVFGNKEKAQQWLSKPLAVFQKKSPLQYAETKEGADFVLDILGRIEYGVFS